ncbi:unnamed protein product [Kuraishia capsulata CBS 1993]|uniref:Uncharacterized protein n=1 Tax=Kuraishia capsulata CBS 1993 TaxID=1382522 RepID=W6MJX0_9ASCO|nr:uncharacterized protein KUCA_T00000804001 [Kuraishia capsulata CBS 1993]CDK24837.1 unnamed protein product [Kuraishia capsulata CBS 1993]
MLTSYWLFTFCVILVNHATALSVTGLTALARGEIPGLVSEQALNEPLDEPHELSPQLVIQEYATQQNEDDWNDEIDRDELQIIKREELRDDKPMELLMDLEVSAASDYLGKLQDGDFKGLLEDIRYEMKNGVPGSVLDSFKTFLGVIEEDNREELEWDSHEYGSYDRGDDEDDDDDDEGDNGDEDDDDENGHSSYERNSYENDNGYQIDFGLSSTFETDEEPGPIEELVLPIKATIAKLGDPFRKEEIITSQMRVEQIFENLDAEAKQLYAESQAADNDPKAQREGEMFLPPDDNEIPQKSGAKRLFPGSEFSLFLLGVMLVILV